MHDHDTRAEDLCYCWEMFPEITSQIPRHRGNKTEIFPGQKCYMCMNVQGRRETLTKSSENPELRRGLVRGEGPFNVTYPRFG